MLKSIYSTNESNNGELLFWPISSLYTSSLPVLYINSIRGKGIVQYYRRVQYRVPQWNGQKHCNFCCGTEASNVFLRTQSKSRAFPREFRGIQCVDAVQFCAKFSRTQSQSRAFPREWPRREINAPFYPPHHMRQKHLYLGNGDHDDDDVDPEDQ